jgi:hypothetical protein
LNPKQWFHATAFTQIESFLSFSVIFPSGSLAKLKITLVQRMLIWGTGLMSALLPYLRVS